MSIAPVTAVNSKVMAETADPKTVYFNEGDSQVEFTGIEPVVLKLTGCYSGDTAIFITNCLGEVISTIDISLSPAPSSDAAKIAEIEAKVANCTHNYTVEVVPATETAEGYTQHTCTLCGHIFRDSYTDKLPSPLARRRAIRLTPARYAVRLTRIPTSRLSVMSGRDTRSRSKQAPNSMSFVERAD